MPNIRVVCWNINNFKGSTFVKHGNTIISKIYNAANVRQIDVFVVVEPFSKMKKFGLASLVTEGAGLDGVLSLYFALANKDLAWKVVPLRTTATPPVSDMIALFYHSDVVDLSGPDELAAMAALVTSTPTPAGHSQPWNAANDRWGKVRFYNAAGAELNFFGRRPTLFHAGAPDRVAKTFTVNVVAPTGAPAPSVVTNLLPIGAENQPYEVQLQADGGTAPYTWAQDGTTVLVAGLVFNPLTGIISGTPTAAGPCSLDVTLTDNTGATDSVALAFNVVAAGAPLALETAGALPDALQNDPYRVRLVGQGGRGARRMNHVRALLTDVLPPGITVGADGLISGAPTTVATPSFDVALRAETGASQTFTMDVVAGGGPLAVFTNALPDGAQGMPYEFLLQATGGTAPYTWAQNGPTVLMAGLAFNAGTGTLGGTPTAAGACSLDVTCTDAVGATANAVLNFAVVAASTTLGFATGAGLPRALQGAPYRMRLASVGGYGSRATTAAGELPAGLELSPDRQVNGFTMAVVAGGGPLAVFTNLLPTGVQGKPYEFLLQATGGTAPYTWAQDGTTVLVAGLAFAPATGIISGTPTAAGPCSLDVTLTDNAGGTVSVALAFNVVAPGVPLAFATANGLPRALLNQPYRMQLASSGGHGRHSMEVSAGSALAPGLTVTLDGLITGTPTLAAPAHPTNIDLYDSSGVISGTPTTATVGHATPIGLADGERTFKLVALHAPPQARHPKNRDSVRQLANIREITTERCGIAVAVCGDFNCCTHPLQNCGSHKAGESAALDPLKERGFHQRNADARSGCKSVARACKDVYATMKVGPNDATLDDLCTHSFDHALTIGFSAVTNVATVNLVMEDPGYAAAKVSAQANAPAPIKGIVKKYLWSSGVSDHLPIRFTLTL